MAIARALTSIRSATAPAARVTAGLPLDILSRFEDDKRLGQAVDAAQKNLEGWKKQQGAVRVAVLPVVALLHAQLRLHPSVVAFSHCRYSFYFLYLAS